MDALTRISGSAGLSGSIEISRPGSRPPYQSTCVICFPRSWACGHGAAAGPSAAIRIDSPIETNLSILDAIAPLVATGANLATASGPNAAVGRTRNTTARGNTMHAQEIIRTHPHVRGNTNDALVRCIEACYDCAQACIACADACLGEDTVKELTQCIRLNLDCADVCTATGAV